MDPASAVSAVATLVVAVVADVDARSPVAVVVEDSRAAVVAAVDVRSPAVVAAAEGRSGEVDEVGEKVGRLRLAQTSA